MTGEYEYRGNKPLYLIKKELAKKKAKEASN